MRASTREGVDVLDATGHGGVYASEASNAKPARFGTGIAPDEEALRASLAKFPDAEPLDALLAAREREMLAREAARRAEKAETGVGVEALGASDEASWSAYAPAHGASVLEVDDASDDATSNANDDATSNDAPSDPDAIERRKRRDAVLAIENARLLDVAASRMADPDRLYTRDPVCGATLAGAAFASNPSRVVFRDFAVGKRYRKRVTITNVSYGTSTFRVMAFPVEHRGSLGVEYDHPGNLSAGMSSRVTVTFAPKIAQTLHTTLSLSTTAGVVEIPVECHPSRANARATTTEVDFGAVVVGETRRRTFALENAGATPAAFELVDPGSESSARVRTTRTSNDPSSPFTVAVEDAGRLLEDGTAVPASEGVVPGYGSVVVVATFAPKAEAREGGFEEEVVVRWIRGDGDEKDGGGDEGDEGDKGDGDSGGGDTLDGPDTLDVLGSSSVAYTVVTLRGVADPAPVRALATSSSSERARRVACTARRSSCVTAATSPRDATRARRNPSRASSTSSRSISSSSHTPRLCFRSSFAPRARRSWRLNAPNTSTPRRGDSPSTFASSLRASLFPRRFASSPTSRAPRWRSIRRS